MKSVIMIPNLTTKIKIILGIETVVILILVIALIVVSTSKSGGDGSSGAEALISVEESEFGHTSNHEIVKKYTLKRGEDFKVELISFGAAIKELHAKCKHGHLNNRVLGFNTIEGILFIMLEM